MNCKRFLILLMFMTMGNTLFLTSCSNEVQENDLNEIQEEPELIKEENEMQTQENLTESVVEEIDKLLLDENENVQTEDILGGKGEDITVENASNDNVIVEELEDFLLDENEDLNLGEVI